MTIILPFTTRGVNLEDFLVKNRAKTKGKRGLYVVTLRVDNPKPSSATSRSKVAKIGIANRDVGLRLKQYQTAVGKHSDEFPCRGVKLHYLVVTNLNRRVQDKNSQVAQIEKFLIKQLKIDKVETDRGREYFRQSNLYKIRDLINSTRFKDIESHFHMKLRSSRKKGS